MRCKPIFVILLISALPLATIASDNNDLNATILYGLDTNPHQLSSGLSPVQQHFAAAEVKLRSSFNRMFYFSAKANKSLYFDDARADRFKAYGSLAFKHKFKIFKKRFKYQFSANYAKTDRTYVSKTTGLVATFGGQSIADRYDSEQKNYLAELSYRPYRTFKWDLSYQNRDKTYAEFNIAGLSNLDYTHKRYLFGMEYKASDLGRFFFNGSFIQREYVDRRAKDLDGNSLAGTDLMYDYAAVDLGYIYRPDKKTRWKYTYYYATRTDNNSGYYDAVNGYLSITGKYQLGDYHFINGRLKYSKFSLENQLDPGDDSLLDEDAKERQGGSALIGYEWVLATLFKTNLALYIELEHTVFANTNPLYTYERSKASAGIRWSAF